ncbi:hypothetical protein Q5698_12685 [Brucella intermedia]|uniref:hypothetical protein n=1 Tax=Brucella intermedia TaxID=94625 RepID=UPI0027362990|nr:hypothetical protein [Brucella intermedia]WLF96474.1 hypothetical protein Q5698_12685 [Brucella intermedia]
METTLEFLTTRKPVREVRRQWPDEVKAKIVLESFCRGIIRDEQTAKVCCRPKGGGQVSVTAQETADMVHDWHLGPFLSVSDPIVAIPSSLTVSRKSPQHVLWDNPPQGHIKLATTEL